METQNGTNPEGYPSNNRWFRRLITGKPHIVIGGAHHPYLLRWYLIPRNRFVNCYLHKFKRSDDMRALHDHPWWFASLILKGQYVEHRADGSERNRRAGSLAFRRPNTLHRVELYNEIVDFGHFTMHREAPTWTLIVTGPKIREWGFDCPGVGWRHWEEFDKRGCE